MVISFVYIQDELRVTLWRVSGFDKGMRTEIWL